jgi:hypothetical protein
MPRKSKKNRQRSRLVGEWLLCRTPRGVLGALFLGEFQNYLDVAAAVEAGDGASG